MIPSALTAVALAWQMLRARALGAVLCIALLALGWGSVVFLMLADHQLKQAFERDVARIDAVVGAKGSPLQLVLSGVFHIDAPTGNIPLAAVAQLAKNPAVRTAIPLSLGDNVGGFRIVGTDAQLLVHFGAQAASGSTELGVMGAVMGAQVAQTLGLAVGAQFEGTHGLGAGGQAHGDAHDRYTVGGVLKPCACVLDRLVLTDLASVWQLHEAHGAAPLPEVAEGDKVNQDHKDHKDHKDHSAPSAAAPAPAQPAREVTVVLITYKSPLAAASFPRSINRDTAYTAASPALEIARLFQLLGAGTAVLRGFAAVLLLVACVSVFAALWQAVRERRADVGLLRLLGARPWRLGALVLTEAWLLGAAGAVLGLLLGHGLMFLAAAAIGAGAGLPTSAHAWLWQELWVVALSLALATLAAAIPAVAAYRASVSDLLSASH